MSKNNSRIIAKIFRETLFVQMISFLTNVMGVMVDGAVIGRFLGTDAMAAYGFINPIATIYLGCSGLFSSGISTLAGRYLGKGDSEETNNVFSSCLICGLAAGCAIMIVTIAGAGPIAALLGAEGEIHAMAVDYLRGFGLSAPATIMLIMLIPVLQLDGKRSSVVAGAVTMTSINIALDFANAFFFHQGLFGMALATAISYYAAVFLVGARIIRKKSMFSFSFRNFRWNHVKGILSYGFPSCYQQICRTLLVAMVNWFLLMRWGSDAVAAYATVLAAGNMCACVGSGMGTAVSMLSGVLCGEENRQSLKNLLITAFKYAIVSGVIIAGVVFVIAEPMISLFVNRANDSDVFSMAVQGIRLFSLSSVIYAINISFRCYFQGMHLFKMSYFFCLMDNFIGTALAVLALGGLFGLNGVWLAYVVGQTFALAALWLLGCVREKRFSFDPENLMFLPSGFGHDESMQMQGSMETMTQVIDVSKAVQAFCLQKGSSPRTAFVMALTFEEMGGNVIEHGFADGKKHSIDYRLICEEEFWVLRLRDDCRAFDPKNYMEYHLKNDPLSNPGIRLVKGLIEDAVYMNTFHLNSIVLHIRRE